MRKLCRPDTLYAWLVLLLRHSSLATEPLEQNPIEVQVWSPVDGTLYLQDSDKILVDVSIEATDAFRGISSEAIVCVHLSRFTAAHDSSSWFSGFSFGNSTEDSLSLQWEAMPPVGNRPECREYGNGALDLPAYAVLDLHPGMYEVRFSVSDAHFGIEVGCTSTFYVRAKHYFQRAVLGVSGYPESQPVPTESGGKFTAANPAPRRTRKPIVVLALKYGTHGDDARASVCSDGKVVLDLPLAQLFCTDTREVQRELAREQMQRTDLRELRDGVWALKPSDEEALSSHLALQAATGFADGCEGVFATSAGVTRMCADVNSARRRWREAAARLHTALRALIGGALDDDSSDDNGEYDGVSLDGNKNADRSITFDAVVFVAATEDLRSLETSPLAHARSVFKAKHWALDDDCQAVGNPALVVWAKVHDVFDALPGNAPWTNTRGEIAHTLSRDWSDASAPRLDIVTSDTASTLRRLLRRLRHSDSIKDRCAFSVCRPGYGWDTTLAHRRLIHPQDTVHEFELGLLKNHAGVDTVDVSGSDDSDINQYLDLWNDAFLSSCDVVAVFPATEGRMRDYCAHGVTQQYHTRIIGSDMRTETRTKSEVQRLRGGQQACETIDARPLGGPAQLIDHDTWWRELAGMRVLVIHPFARTIEAQYAKHHALLAQNASSDGLFPGNPRALPKFAELLTMKPPVGRSSEATSGSWQTQVEVAEQQLRALAPSFDVALVAAGAWGPLLQRFLKQHLHKSSVYVGGALQLHFGIWGGRYIDLAEVRAVASMEHWVWPEEDETANLKARLKGEYNSYATPDSAAQNQGEL